jgi:hypothetical protein
MWCLRLPHPHGWCFPSLGSDIPDKIWRRWSWSAPWPPQWENIDVIKERLEGRQKLTFSVFLLYAFTPLPSNYLFIAYGLTAMELKLIAIPFFLGRSVSYSFWAIIASAVARRISFEFTEGLSYLSVYFVVSQFLLLSIVYAFTRIDWRALFNEKKLKWIAAGKKESAHLRDGP